MKEKSKKPIITIVSSFAQDRIRDTAGILHRRKGGPAYWIGNALKRLRVPYSVVAGRKPAIVDIQIDAQGEHGQFVTVEPIRIHDLHKAEAFILSTIDNEFPIEQISLLQGILAVDFQGYVRCARMAGTLVRILSSLARRISIAQVTSSELPYLDPRLVSSQKQRVLIVTGGSRGVDVFSHGKRYHGHGKLVVSRDTIGAGDTFFAAFLVEWIRTQSVEKAAQRAQSAVEVFLKKKKPFV